MAMDGPLEMPSVYKLFFTVAVLRDVLRHTTLLHSRSGWDWSPHDKR